MVRVMSPVGAGAAAEEAEGDWAEHPGKASKRTRNERRSMLSRAIVSRAIVSRASIHRNHINRTPPEPEEFACDYLTAARLP
jgi:hypothetical protein